MDFGPEYFSQFRSDVFGQGRFALFLLQAFDDNIQAGPDLVVGAGQGDDGGPMVFSHRDFNAVFDVPSGANFKMRTKGRA